MGHRGPVAKPLRACLLVCKMSLRDHLRIQQGKERKVWSSSGHGVSAELIVPALPAPLPGEGGALVGE